jgi:hypothetical protein
MMRVEFDYRIMRHCVTHSDGSITYPSLFSRPSSFPIHNKFIFLGGVSFLSVPAYEGPPGLANGRITAIFSLHHSQTLNPGITNNRLFYKHFK